METGKLKQYGGWDKMKMGLLPRGMWTIFHGNFEKRLPMLGVTDTRAVMADVKRRYRDIIQSVQTFGENDTLKMNIISAAMLAAVYLSLPEPPEVEQLTQYYAKAMDHAVMRLFLRRNNYYTTKYQRNLARNAEKSQQSRNPYSWRFVYQPGPDLNSYDVVFDHCGICYLFQQLGIAEITPAMCAYDYTMAEQTGTVFTRRYTLADGGPHCDCHYRKENKQ